VITYRGTRTSPKELDLAVTVDIAGSKASDSVSVLNPRQAPPPAEGPAVAEPPVRVFASKAGFYLGIFAAFGALLLLFGVLFWRPGGSALKLVRRGLRISTRRATKESDSNVMSSAIARRAVELVDQMPKPKGFEERLQLTLERAGWPLRASEFLALQGVAAAAGAAIGLGLFLSGWLGFLLAVIGAATPRLVLAQRVQRRGATFVAQLPDTLQLLSASLQAGYGLLQAIDTVTKEAPAPTSSEFSRVLTEARLGMPLEQALESMAVRIGNEDFHWVVMAINIQRQVGGNLAQVLETTAGTLREREQLRRQVKVLSAEGRISAVILSLLPFLLAGYMAVVNPEYVGELFRHFIGKVMVAGALGLMVAGVLWMRKLVKIEI
jgi:tight adherence protein B